MKKKIIGGLIGVLLSAAICSATSTRISYTSTDLGSGRWQYTYDVTNIGLAENIEEFTIWFDYGLYDNLVVETLSPLSGRWDELIIQSEPAISDDGFYDALSLNLRIASGEIASGFSVSFGWLGLDTPCSQFYEIINPITFETIDSGFTVPEPATLFMLGIGGLGFRRQMKNHYSV